MVFATKSRALGRHAESSPQLFRAKGFHNHDGYAVSPGPPRLQWRNEPA